MDVYDEEIFELWKALSHFQVEYIMVGGFAINLHGFQRTTGDLDLWLKDTKENRKRLQNAFKEAGIGDFQNLETVEFVPGWTSIFLNSGFEIDLMSYIKGFSQADFDKAYQNASTAIILNVSVKFLHLNDLIEAKRASGRERDKIDLKMLEEIKRRNENLE
jgi:hypothetical protein